MARKAKVAADESRLITEGGSRPRQRKGDARSWTKAKEETFLKALAESCNVKHAALAAGVSYSNIYVRRASIAKFRAAWDQAMATGYAQLEMMMLERALHGVEKTIPPVGGNGPSQVMREYNDRMGLALLRMHRDTARLAEEGSDPGEVEEAVERIIARLGKLKDRDPIETKAAQCLLALIRDALRARGKAR